MVQQAQVVETRGAERVLLAERFPLERPDAELIGFGNAYLLTGDRHFIAQYDTAAAAKARRRERKGERRNRGAKPARGSPTRGKRK